MQVASRAPLNKALLAGTAMTIDALLAIDSALAELELKIIEGGSLGSFADSRDRASLTRLRIEAKTLLGDALGLANNFFH